MVKKSQIKIQQMAFMILAVFFFFILVGLFFLNWQMKDIERSFTNLQKEQAISSLSVIADMPELNCDSRESFCLDVDKVEVMASSNYDDFWPVASIKVYKIYPKPHKEYIIYSSNQSNIKEFSAYVSLCKKINEFGYVYENCDIGKLVVGVAE